MLKVSVRFDGNEFTVEGADVTWEKVEPLLKTWLSLQVMSGAKTEAELMALSERLQTGNRRLADTVEAAGS